ncbi:hypothetical protein ACSRUE_01435 [Sorangium sp. KYC3313]|uniref:hypothetical protein n=1 Tax=Sorangium sp. KYC3313 TaxID=3449740 RepID=UPI003F8AEFE0
MQIGLASQQLNVARAQASQLLAINNQLAYQQAVQQQQAILNQVIFETEQAAAYLSDMTSRDPFAAGILSCIRLRNVQGIDASFFHALDAKRSWTHATGRLASNWQWVDGHPQLGDPARRFVQSFGDLMRWREVLGPDPQGEMSRREAQAKKDDTSFKVTLWITGAGPVAFIGGALAHVSLISIAGVLLLLGGAIKMLSDYGAKLKSGKAAAEYRQQLDQFNAFMSNPDGGGFLGSVASKHPQLAA